MKSEVVQNFINFLNTQYGFKITKLILLPLRYTEVSNDKIYFIKLQRAGFFFDHGVC